MSLQLSVVEMNAIANLVATAHNNGYINFYSGPEPSTVDTPLVVGNVLMASFRFAATAFATSVAGLIVANPIASTAILASGTLVFFRTFAADGTTALVQGTIGLGVVGIVTQTTTTVVVTDNNTTPPTVTTTTTVTTINSAADCIVSPTLSPVADLPITITYFAWRAVEVN